MFVSVLFFESANYASCPISSFVRGVVFDGWQGGRGKGGGRGREGEGGGRGGSEVGFESELTCFWTEKTEWLSSR